MKSMSDDDLTEKSIVSRCVGQISCNLDGEVVAMSVAEGKYYQLDKVGAAIWEQLNEPLSLFDLCSRLRERFAVAGATCEADTIAFLSELKEAGLVEWHCGVSS